MNVGEYVPALAREVEAFRAAVLSGDLSTDIAACPGWSLADLVWHLGTVQQFWSEIVGRRLQARGDVIRDERPADAELVDWFNEVSTRLADVLATVEPQTSVWTWSDQHNVAFVRRRMAQEAAVHRWDAQAAVGLAEPVGHDLAVDGIDEFVRFMVPDGPPIPDRIVISVAGEEQRWQLGAASERGADLSGDASDLLLVLWRRLPLQRIQVTGNEQAARDFLDRTELE